MSKKLSDCSTLINESDDYFKINKQDKMRRKHSLIKENRKASFKLITREIQSDNLL